MMTSIGTAQNDLRTTLFSTGSRTTLLRFLLICGILSTPLYAATDLVTGLLYEGYSFADQTVSELSAIGAPTRPLWLALGPVYQALMTIFGFGVWASAGGRRAPRVAGALLIAYGLIGFTAPFVSMHQREFLAAFGPTLTDRLHLVVTGVAVLIMFVAMVFAAWALGKRFRFYTMATIVVSLAAGGWTSRAAPLVEANLPTPWIGAAERVSIAVFMIWVVVLAIILLRRVGERTEAGPGLEAVPAS